jgi:low affinity Fe/Cu permease
MQELFRRIAHRASGIMGSGWAFVCAATVVILWAISGPLFHFSTTWQLFINTMTTILTFLMVFLIQNTQNRDAHAIQLKLDELIKVIGPARNELIDIEEDVEDKLRELDEEFRKARHQPSTDNAPLDTR